ncbi:MAG: sulfotransferase domain-containing protein [Cyanobacteria bacterium P01_H01_bin.15]
MKQPKLPNFIIFGTTKSGSTSLCNYIQQHPDVFISERKEPNYFLHEEGTSAVNRKGEVTEYTLEWYKNWFRYANQKAIGEASVSYLGDETAPIRIKQTIPDVKLIAILREPVSRMYSHYLFAQRRGVIPDVGNLLKAFEYDQAHDSMFKFFEKGLYAHNLKSYFAQFDAEQIKLFLFEDFTSNPGQVTKDVFEFLEVDSNFEAMTTAKDASSGIPRNQSVYEFLYRDNPIKKILRPITRTVFPNAEKRRALWTRLVSSSLSKPQLSPKIKEALREKYRPDILELQEMIGRDLSKWLE